jgi:hypothetical protein
MNSKKNNIKPLEIEARKYYVYTSKRINKATLIYYLYSVQLKKNKDKTWHHLVGW